MKISRNLRQRALRGRHTRRRRTCSKRACLDAAPVPIARLESIGDECAVDILRVIQRDEVEHVRIGNRWYEYLCARRRLDPLDTFRRLLDAYGVPRPRPPFDLAARRRAGFRERELRWFEELATER